MHYTVPPASAPSAQITTPVDGATHAIDASVRAAYSCAEGSGGPGLLSGSVSGTTLGLLKLGMTRAQAAHANTHSSTRGKAYEQFFCLTPRGVRVGYTSSKELASLPKQQRARYAGRVIWISTSSAFYAIDGVRVGATVTATAKRLRLEPVFVVGLNDWYLAPAGAATAVLKVRQGVVQEIGIGDKNLTETRKAQRRFLTSFE